MSGGDFLKFLASMVVAMLRGAFVGLVQFFESSLFFIFLGIGFLIAADRLTDSAHPTFIFLLAILGVSIVLYGTGTQGAGSGQIGNVPIKVTVAGGAGVLAAVFGFGVAWLGPSIQDAFKVPHQYARIVLNLNYNGADNQIQRDLRTLYVTATSRDGRPLHLLIYEDRIEILEPVTYSPEQTGVCVNLTLPPNKSVTGRPNCPVLTWKKNEGGPDAELVTYVGVGALPLAPPKATRVDEANDPTQQVSNDDFK